MELETVERIVEILSAHAVSEITVEREGMRIVAKKGAVSLSLAAPAALATPLPAAEDILLEETALDLEPVAETAAPEPALLTAGLVGLFRHSEPPLGYGTVVAPGQIVGSIEAMKVLNDVRADAAGQVVDVLIEEGAPVEYGQPLFRLMPA